MEDKVDKKVVSDWIARKREEAKEGLKEADMARRESEDTDVDALEQGVYNRAALDLLDELEVLIAKG